MSQRKIRRAMARGRRAALAAGAVVGASAAFVPAAQAATFTVSNNNDTGAGSLRAAVGSANTTPDSGGPDHIAFDLTNPGFTSHTITLTSGELLVKPTTVGNELVVDGPGADNLTVSGNDASRVFNLDPDSGAVTISGLTITHGAATTNGGGAIRGGAVLTPVPPPLTLSHVVVSDSKSTNGNGGGIASNRRLTISDSTIT